MPHEFTLGHCKQQKMSIYSLVNLSAHPPDSCQPNILISRYGERTYPPSTVRTSPLTYRLARLARYTIEPLKSSGRPHRPAGIRSRMLFALCSSLMRASFISVWIYPGAIWDYVRKDCQQTDTKRNLPTALTLIPSAAHWLDRLFVS